MWQDLDWRPISQRLRTALVRLGAKAPAVKLHAQEPLHLTWVDVLFSGIVRGLRVRTDHLFAVLLLVEWVAAVATAVWLTPRTWIGAQNPERPHAWIAVLLGGVIVLPALHRTWKKPGTTATRHIVAVSQMLLAGLLIHLSGGRIGTHFHVFGSLAVLAFYRDWKVLATATLVTALDHLLRGHYWPMSVYGVVAASPWRSLEYLAWVVFENAVLCAGIRQSRAEARHIADRQAELLASSEHFETAVIERTSELRESEARTRRVVETALDAVITMDHEGFIQGWNPQAQHTFGWPAEKVLGKELAEVIIPVQHREAHRKGMARYLASGETRVLHRRIEVNALHRSGREFPAELAIVPIPSARGTTFTAFVRDITERRRVAEQLQAAKEAAEETARAKSDFLASVSHELRTPLTAIHSFTEILLEEDTTCTPEERRSYLSIVAERASHLNRLISELLDFSKIEAGKFDCHLQPVSIRDATGPCLASLQAIAAARQIELRDAVDAALPQIVGDADRICQVITNLVGNALKFTPPGGSIVVAARRSGVRRPADAEGAAPFAGLEATKLPAGEYVVLSVRDSGPGIALRDQQRVFEKFTQLGNVLTGKPQGTGLGLAIAGNIVVQHGGALWVESVAGEGATFAFSLPVHAVHAARPRQLFGLDGTGPALTLSAAVKPDTTSI